MKNINDQHTDIDQYVSAVALKEMTLSEEDLFEIQKENICENLMSSMVSVATKQGRDFYGANLLTSMSQSLVDDVVKFFDDLGYDTSLGQATNDPATGQEFKVLTISWKDAQ